VKLASPFYIQSAQCSNMLKPRACLETTLYNVPQFLALIIAGILDLQVSSLGYDLLGSERPLGMSPS